MKFWNGVVFSSSPLVGGAALGGVAFPLLFGVGWFSSLLLWSGGAFTSLAPREWRCWACLCSQKDDGKTRSQVLVTNLMMNLMKRWRRGFLLSCPQQKRQTVLGCPLLEKPPRPTSQKDTFKGDGTANSRPRGRYVNS